MAVRQIHQRLQSVVHGSAHSSVDDIGNRERVSHALAFHRGKPGVHDARGRSPGSAPIKLVTGLTTKAGALFGNPGPFFVYQQFSLGGVQYGEQLRGYEEFSISPRGYLATTDQFNAQQGSFGSAFFTTSAE